MISICLQICTVRGFPPVTTTMAATPLPLFVLSMGRLQNGQIVILGYQWQAPDCTFPRFGSHHVNIQYRMNYALLVGVNTYESPEISNLNGCENDVDAMAAYLKRQFSDNIEILCLKSEEATRQNIIDGFRNHLAQAGEGELAFFYFSGHGCREPSPEAFYPYQQDKYHENIVPHDSLTGAEDLADKEMKLLISELSARGGEVAVLYDCCHAGSGTRSKEEVFRLTNDRPGVRPKEAFLRGVFEQLGRKEPRHLFMAACSQEELSRERRQGFPRKWGGLFTRMLLEALNQTTQPGLISYANLGEICRMGLKRRVKNANQTPKVEALGGFNANKLFLQSKDDDRQPDMYAISQDLDGRWKVNLGRVHGLPVQAKARFAVFTANSGGEQICIGEAETLHTGLFDSEVRLPEGFMPLANTVLLVPATHLPIERMYVYVSENHLAQIKQAIHHLPEAREIDPASDHIAVTRQAFLSAVFLTTDPTQAIYGIAVGKEAFRLFYAESGQDMVTGAGEVEFPVIAKALMQIAQWERLRTLDNQNSSISNQKDDISLIYHNVSENEQFDQQNITLDIHTEFEVNSQSQVRYLHPIRFALNISSYASSPLYCACYYLSRHFQIEQLQELKIPNDGEQRQLDKANLYIGVHKEPELNQITDLYTVILSKFPLPLLNLNAPP